MAVRGPGSWRCLVQHSENGSIPPVLMCGKVFAPMFYCNVYYGTEADGGNPYTYHPLKTTTQHKTLLSSAVACLHPPELSSGVPPITRGLPRDLRQSAISDKKQSVATCGQLAVTAQYCHQCCPITAHLNTRVVNKIMRKFIHFFNRDFSLSKVPTATFYFHTALK